MKTDDLSQALTTFAKDLAADYQKPTVKPRRYMRLSISPAPAVGSSRKRKYALWWRRKVVAKMYKATWAKEV